MKHKTTNNSKKRTIGLMLAGIALSVQAQNPIISGQFTADPTARVFNGKVYLYPSHDIPAPEGQQQDWFCMADYHVFSSDDLVNWHDHGVIVDQKDVLGASMMAIRCGRPTVSIRMVNIISFSLTYRGTDVASISVWLQPVTLPDRSPVKVNQSRDSWYRPLCIARR